jgi:hypothetical protein
VVQRARLERVRQRDGLARARDVQPLVHVRGRGHVVDRGEMEDVVDPAAVLLDPRVVHPETRELEVADHGLDALGLRPAGQQRVEPLARALAHEDVDVALAVAQQLLHQVAPDEAGRASHEIRHSRVLPGPQAYLRP